MGFPLLLAVDFGLQIVMFAVSFSLKTDHFYDMTGTSTFVILALMSYFQGTHFFERQVILCIFSLTRPRHSERRMTS